MQVTESFSLDATSKNDRREGIYKSRNVFQKCLEDKTWPKETNGQCRAQNRCVQGTVPDGHRIHYPYTQGTGPGLEATRE